MNSAALLFVLKCAIVLVTGYYLGLVLIGANMGAKFWKDAEKEEKAFPPRIARATSAFRWLTHFASFLIVAGYLLFCLWWLDLWHYPGGAI